MTSEPLPPSDRISVEPTAAQLAVVAEPDAERSVVMLNLLRFREIADYSAHPELEVSFERGPSVNTPPPRPS